MERRDDAAAARWYAPGGERLSQHDITLAHGLQELVILFFQQADLLGPMKQAGDERPRQVGRRDAPELRQKAVQEQDCRDELQGRLCWRLARPQAAQASGPGPQPEQTGSMDEDADRNLKEEHRRHRQPRQGGRMDNERRQGQSITHRCTQQAEADELLAAIPQGHDDEQESGGRTQSRSIFWSMNRLNQMLMSFVLRAASRKLNQGHARQSGIATPAITTNAQSMRFRSAAGAASDSKNKPIKPKTPVIGWLKERQCAQQPKCRPEAGRNAALADTASQRPQDQYQTHRECGGVHLVPGEIGQRQRVGVTGGISPQRHHHKQHRGAAACDP